LYGKKEYFKKSDILLKWKILLIIEQLLYYLCLNVKNFCEKPQKEAPSMP